MRNPMVADHLVDLRCLPTHPGEEGVPGLHASSFRASGSADASVEVNCWYWYMPARPTSSIPQRHRPWNAEAFRVDATQERDRPIRAKMSRR